VSRAPSKSDPFEPGDELPFFSLRQLDSMDRKFVAAMLKAIAAGAEGCPIGVDTRPGTKRPILVTMPLPAPIKTNFGEFE
jgi:hypothetical protein